MPRREIQQLVHQLDAIAIHGCVTPERAAEFGIGRHRLARAAKTGALHRIVRGHYGLREDSLARARHQVIRLSDRGIDAVLGGVSAAQVWGIPVFGRTGPVSNSAVTLLVPPGAGLREGERHGVRIRAAQIAPLDVTVIDGVPVTRPLRTGLDVARHLGRCRPSALIPLSGGMRAEAARRLSGSRDVNAHDVTEHLLSNALLRTDLVSDLNSLIVRVNAHGMKWVLRVLPDVEPLLETALEALVWAALTRAKIPRPRPQRWLSGASGQRYRVDFLVSDRVIVEADGAVKYADQTPWQEKQRQSDLEAAGYWVVRCTWQEVLSSPEDIVARIRLALARSDPAPRRPRPSKTTVRNT